MNWSRWKDLYEWPYAMDWRHVCMINAVLEMERPWSLCEIGCHKGFSTSAVVEADERTAFGWVDLVDTYVHDSLRQMADGRRFQMLRMDSKDYKGTPECWMIDGEHHDGARADWKNCKAAKPRIVVIHDSHPDIGNNHGAVEIANYARMECVQWFEDFEPRQGELTQRGLFVGFCRAPHEATLARLRELACAKLGDLQA